MKKSHINNFLVECISDISIDNDDENVVSFKCGELYLMEIIFDNIKCTVKHISKQKNNNCGNFVFNTKLYDGLNFHEYFIIVQEFDKTHASTIVYNATKSEERYNDNIIYGEVKKTRHINDSDTDFYVFLNGPRFNIFRDINNNIEYGITDDITIDQYVDKYTTTDNLLSLELTINGTKGDIKNKVDISEILNFKNSKKLKYLRFRYNNYNFQKDYQNLKDIKKIHKKISYPKNLEELQFSGFNINSLDDINVNNKLVIYNCNISNLSFKKLQDININIYNITFDNYDNKYFETTIENTYRYLPIQIFKIDDDKYLTNITDNFLTKDETELMCSTWQFHDAMDIFEFDKNREFDLKSYKISNVPDEIDVDNNFCFDIVGDKIQITKKGDNILFFKNSKFTFIENYYINVNIWYNIKTKKLIADTLSLYDCNKHILDDNTMATIIKTCEDLPFKPTFIDKFLNTYNIKNSKYLGEIKILDFNFDMINNKLNNAKCVGIKFIKNEGWYMLVEKEYTKYNRSYVSDVRTNVFREYSEIDAFWELIDFGIFGFELPTNKISNNFTIMDHTDENYYNRISKNNILIQDNSIELYNGKLDIHKVDETIKYKFNINSDILYNKHEMMELDGKLYKLIIDKKPFSFKPYFNKNNEINLDIAEKLSKKYDIKLNIDNIRHQNKTLTYNNIQQISENNQSILSTIIEYCTINKNPENGDERLTGLQLLPNNYREYITTKQTHKKFETKFIKVKDNVYLLWSYCGNYKIDSINGIELMDNNILFKKICEEISNNNNEFSFVNLDIPQHVIENIDNIINKNKNLFETVFDNTFFLQKDIRDVGYITRLMTITDSTINYHFGKKEKTAEKLITIVNNVKSTLKEYFIKLQTKNIETKSVHEINYNFIDRGRY